MIGEWVAVEGRNVPKKSRVSYCGWPASLLLGTQEGRRNPHPPLLASQPALFCEV